MTSTTLNSSNIQEQVQALIEHYQKALIIKPNSPDVYQHLGDFFDILGDKEKVAKHYFKAVKNVSDGFQILYSQEYDVYYLKEVGILFKLFSYLRGDNLPKSQKNKIIKDITGFLFSEFDISLLMQTRFLGFILGSLQAELGDFEQAINFLEKENLSQIKKHYPDLIDQRRDRARQPNFLIPGFWKSGTSACYQYLTQHPKVLPALSKEIFYFSQEKIIDLDYYLAHFPAFGDDSYLTGEASCTYAIGADIPQLIKALFPEIKIIFLLQNPIDRAVSQWYMKNKLEYQYLGRSLSHIDSIDQTIDFTPFMDISCYIRYLPSWFDCFSPEQILVIKSEDLFANSQTTMNQIHGFLGLPEFTLDHYPKINKAQYPPITASLRQQLAEFFKPYNEQLEDYLGRKFDWD